ncbi:hypothetical protein M5689_009406 [Euphorbia peplus]|nr:hypothetical protein M5689_009406 [Euphorbia peplus]
MGNRGPSPVVPFLAVGVLGLIIFGPLLMSLVEFVLPLFQASDEEDEAPFSLFMVLPLILLLVVHLMSSVCPKFGSSYSSIQQTHAPSYDSGESGLGTLLLVLLFFVLYYIW